jgi:hypothetical protein
MKIKMFCLLTTALLMCCPSLFAFDEFENEGIHYVINFYEIEEQCAWVTSTAGIFLKDGVQNEYTGDIVIPNKVWHDGQEYRVIGIYMNAFKRCTLNSLTLSEGVTYLAPAGASAFDSTYVESIYLPSTFRIDPRAFFNGINGYCLFSGCKGLKKIVIASDNPVYDSRDNCNALIETATNTLLEGCENTIIPSSVETINAQAFLNRDIKECHIPYGVNFIKGSVFENCKQLENVTIPESVSRIYADGLFQGCELLENVTIPETAILMGAPEYDCENEKAIAGLMFRGCYSLKGFQIPDYVTIIGIQAFRDCKNLSYIVIPESVSDIRAFAFIGCENLNSITMSAGVPPSVNEYCFDASAYSRISLTVPEGSEEAYRQHEVWGKFQYINAPAGIKEIYNPSETNSRMTYDLSGRRVSRTGKGIYIVGGRKVVK